jgi:thiol:disulfide interchange protein DsbD
MLPITLGVIGTKNSKSSLQSFGYASVYVLGIALTYSVLGVFAAVTGSLFGSALQNPYIVGSIASIFVLMGLSMFDVFFVQVPSEFQTKLSKIYKNQNKSYLGVFVMGLISGLIATPCVGPVIVSMLTFVAQTKNIFLGFWLLFTFAIGMGLILILFGTFSNRLANLPRAGGWMENIKKAMGLVMFGVAFYYIKPITPEYIFEGLLGIGFVILGTFLGASFVIDENSSNKLKFSKSMGILTITTGLYLFVNTLASKELFGSNFISSNTVVSQVSKDIKNEKITLDWQKSEKEGLVLAQLENKYAMIDFYADWCEACHELDNNTYNNQDVINELKDFISIKIDATKSTPEINKLLSKYGVLGLPAVIFIDKKGNVLNDFTLSGFEKPKDFIKRLKQVKDFGNTEKQASLTFKELKAKI